MASTPEATLPGAHVPQHESDGDGGFTRWLRQARAVKQADSVGVLAQAFGILYYWGRIGTRRREFYMYRLHDPRVPAHEKAAVLSTARWYGMVDRINPPRYQYLVDDKTTFGTLLRQYGLATADVLDVFDTERRDFLASGVADNAAAFVARLRGFGGDGIVVKDERGRQGAHVYVVRAFTDATVVLADREVTHDVFFRTLCAAPVQRFLVQRRLRPHPSLRPLAYDTLPTIRVVTYLADGSHPRVLRASLRIPRVDAGVDNFSAGNLAAAVDLERGTLGEGLERETGTRYTHHPVTGAPIAGASIADWRGVVALVERAAVCFAALPTVGWDVALTENGPALIEGNSRYNFNVIQMPQNSGLWQGPFREWCEGMARRTAPRPA